jgi:hypothetical protein
MHHRKESPLNSGPSIHYGSSHSVWGTELVKAASLGNHSFVSLPSNSPFLNENRPQGLFLMLPMCTRVVLSLQSPRGICLLPLCFQMGCFC